MKTDLLVDRFLKKRNLPDLAEPREHLAERLLAQGVPEKIVAVMKAIPRHAFAPPHLWRLAYSDVDLWGPTAFLPSPQTVARVLGAMPTGPKVSILEYATGQGYFASLLALMAESVYTVEHDPWLLWMSSDAFRELNLPNIRQKASDGTIGWEAHAPYGAIFVDAAVPTVPKTLINQLGEGGTLVAPVGPYLGPHRLIKVSRDAKTTTSTDLGNCYFPPLTGVWDLAGSAALLGATNNVDRGDKEPPRDQLEGIAVLEGVATALEGEGGEPKPQVGFWPAAQKKPSR